MGESPEPLLFLPGLRAQQAFTPGLLLLLPTVYNHPFNVIISFWGLKYTGGLYLILSIKPHLRGSLGKRAAETPENEVASSN